MKNWNDEQKKAIIDINDLKQVTDKRKFPLSERKNQKVSINPEYYINKKLEREQMNIESFKRIKKEKGIKNYEIHKRTGVLESTLSEFERGKHTDLRISTLIKIADALDVTLDELVGRKKNGIFLNPDDYIKKNEINKSIVIGTFESKK